MNRQCLLRISEHVLDASGVVSDLLRDNRGGAVRHRKEINQLYELSQKNHDAAVPYIDESKMDVAFDKLMSSYGYMFMAVQLAREK